MPQPVAQNMLFYHADQYRPFKVNPVSVYGQYMSSDTSVYHRKCPRNEGPHQQKLTEQDIENAVRYAASTVDRYASTITDNAMETNRRTPYIPNGVLDSKVFEYASQYITKR